MPIHEKDEVNREANCSREDEKAISIDCPRKTHQKRNHSNSSELHVKKVKRIKKEIPECDKATEENLEVGIMKYETTNSNDSRPRKKPNPWTPLEDKLLLECLHDLAGEGKWKRIADAMNNGRNADNCRHRFNTLKNIVAKGGPLG
ncbi:1651_t:CDS:2 [Acaulospora colombiana]|uniref:1651_t:CDS:1 n=1 Tax=Acaulospora colombiana TaxID=27376 RepID=A0ACA9JZ65_9GLOM|nr:1651_t:CDS:2 [Acaulospora colombiana]